MGVLLICLSIVGSSGVAGVAHAGEPAGPVRPDTEKSSTLLEFEYDEVADVGVASVEVISAECEGNPRVNFHYTTKGRAETSKRIKQGPFVSFRYSGSEGIDASTIGLGGYLIGKQRGVFKVSTLTIEGDNMYYFTIKPALLTPMAQADSIMRIESDCRFGPDLKLAAAQFHLAPALKSKK